MHVYIIISPAVRSDILTLLVMNINLYWDRMPYNLVINYWYSEWTTLKMKAVSSSEILLWRYQTKWHHIPGKYNLHFASCFSSPYSILERWSTEMKHTQCMNSGTFILLLSPNFQFLGCEMTQTPFKTKTKTYGKSKKT